MNKRILSNIMILVILTVSLTGCVISNVPVTNDEGAENVAFVKDFYTQYLNEVEKNECDYNKLNTLKKKYLTEVMAQEMEFRSRHADADMYVMSQDPVGLSKALVVEKGDGNGWVNVRLNTKNEYGAQERLIKIHVINVNGEKKIDTLDNYEKRYDKDGKLEEEFSNITKYGNKSMTDELKKEIDKEIEHFKKIDEEGYID